MHYHSCMENQQSTCVRQLTYKMQYSLLHFVHTCTLLTLQLCFFYFYFCLYIHAGSPIVTSLTYNDQYRTLTCNSTGGPATNVTWRRDGVVIALNATHQQTKRLVDAVNGVRTRQCSPLTHQWVRVTLWGDTTAQWRMSGESLQRQWIYHQVRLDLMYIHSHCSVFILYIQLHTVVICIVCK